jgi:site-specific DNA-methyltransferase (adenine-specific)/adenine-specific DNA-methyltransferase
MNESDTIHFQEAFMADKELFEFEQREPIRGYPELHWAGKRPYTSTQYYPAQCRESYGKAVDGWMNRLYWGDNLQVMSHLMKEFRGEIDLIYIDPPFDSKADYKKKIEVKGQTILNDNNSFEEKQYRDIWTNDEYLQFMYERLVLMRELLSDTGSIYLHCDWRVTHHIKYLLDEILGPANYKNEIIWQGAIGDTSAKNKKFIKSHDTIWFFSKNQTAIWNDVFQEFSETSEKLYKFNDEKGAYRIGPIDNPGGNGYKYELGFGEKIPANGYRMPKETALDWLERGLLDIREGKVPGKKIYKNENGVRCRDVWTDVASIQGNEHQGYPTQKPEALLERIIKASSNPGGIVFDCFMGSGTTQAVAMKLGRRFIGADINLGAIQTTTKRLLGIAGEINAQLDTETRYTGFEVYNVNNYDFFRNPVEAKELLIDYFEIQASTGTQAFDGEKDGRMIKIMPVDRICCRADLEGFLSLLPYKTWKKKLDEHPEGITEKISLYCMGHEPDLQAVLQKELSRWNVDVEVFDILREKKDLELKRDSEADITIHKGRLVIKKFYPMNLMQKLSLERTAVKDDWRMLVESVMIDFNYDGAVLHPSITDIPAKNDLVKGEYEIPKNAGTIRVKITDLLSESLEIEVENG